jgi:superfamily II DNA or RNA helicase/HKD family nuclease
VAHGRGLPGLVVAIGHASGAIPPACRRHTPAGVRETARVDDLAPGLYEALIDEVLAGRLRELQPDIVEQRALRPADAADRLSRFVAEQVRRVVSAMPDSDRVEGGVALIRALSGWLAQQSGRRADLIDTPDGDQVLRAIGSRRPDGTVRRPTSPLIPLLDTTLLTNARGEPHVGGQLVAEIDSADSIDIVMAFIRRSGLRPFQEALRRHCERGRPLRVLTTTYTGSTEAAALDVLTQLGAEVRVSYDLASTRLHAKAWLFQRRSSFSTAYVGSSNLTHSAQVAGLEWNVRLSSARNPDAVKKIEAVFDGYWQGGDFVPYSLEQFAGALEQVRRRDSAFILSPVEIHLHAFQERLLELVEVARQHGHNRNLLVSATGTGKTVMAAMDYVRLRQTMPRARLLFVAHRDEILQQSRATFRHALRDHAFGEKWIRGERPTHHDHVFASIQSLAPSGLQDLNPTHYDIVIIDEFHHAAAPSYERLLQRLQPRQLLGLTATPERSDGLPILHWFDDRIAAELRVWDAIDQQYLSPFAYYGISDGTDLRAVPWRRGQGYDVTALSDVYTGSDWWANTVIAGLVDHVDDPQTMRCLGFCVSVAHARFMADRFVAAGITAIAVSGQSREDERREALDGLRAGRINAVFSVDLFNEGVDVPAVDVVLMLRPTESATVFLQQLGRGLRRSDEKQVCTVLDFVGTHRREFRLDLRYRALLGGTRTQLARAIEAGFPFLPSGCQMQLDEVVKETVLRSIRDAVPSRWAAKTAELRALHRTVERPTLGKYLTETGLELSDVYSNQRGWSDLCDAAGVPVLPPGAHETPLRRGVSRMLHVDDDYRISGFQQLLERSDTPDVATMSVAEQRLLRMLVSSVANKALGKTASLQQAVDLVWSHSQVRAELTQLMEVLRGQVDHVHAPVEQDGVQLRVHARYTRIEILAAVGEGAGGLTPQWREGVYDAKGVGADLLAFTLDKTSGEFSPTTRYSDYALSRELIHWESQSVTRAQSPTGIRYQKHRELGRRIYLFARNGVDDRAFWFLGPAAYVSHIGEKPMAVTWKLETPLPGDLYAAFAAAVA